MSRAESKKVLPPVPRASDPAMRVFLEAVRARMLGLEKEVADLREQLKNTEKKQ